MTSSGLAERVPLRTLVLSLLLATVALVVLLTSVAGVVALRGYLLDRVDDQLVETVQRAVGPRDRPRGGGRFAPPGTSFTALVDPSGAVLPQGVDDDDAADGPQLPALDADAVRRLEGPFTVRGARGGSDWRVGVQPLPSGSAVVVALPLEGVDATVHRLLLIDLLVGLGALLAAGALGAAGVRRSLRPLTVVESTAEAIAAGDLSVRVPVAGPTTEVGSLATSFNSMVDRFETAYGAQQTSEAEARASEERMRRFVGDASHELRTPLTSIRGFAELYRQGAVPPETLPRVVRRIEDEASRMGLLVDDLLLLARLDQQRPLERSRVDLLTVAADVVHDAAAVTDHEVRLVPPDRTAGRRPRRRRAAAAGARQPGGQRHDAHTGRDDGGAGARGGRHHRGGRGARRRSGDGARRRRPGVRALLPGGHQPHPRGAEHDRQRSRALDRRRPGRGPRRHGRRRQHARPRDDGARPAAAGLVTPALRLVLSAVAAVVLPAAGVTSYVLSDAHAGHDPLHSLQQLDLLYLDEPAPGVDAPTDGRPVLVLLCDGCRVPDVARASVLVRPELAQDYGVVEGRTGYALVDRRGHVRYRTVDPAPAAHAREIQTLLDGL